MDFAGFYQEQSKAVFFFIFRSTRNEALAQDLTQEVFLNYFRHYWEKQEVRNPRALLLKMARHAAINHSNLKSTESLEESTVPDIRAQPGEDRSREVMEFMDSLLALMDVEDRDLLRLRYDQELTYVEIGEVVGLSETTAIRRIQKAENKLQDLCKKRGVRLEDYL